MMNNFVPGNWMVARSTGWHRFDFFLRKKETETELCGPFWLSVIRQYTLIEGDIIHFNYVESEKLFLFTVFDALGVEKEADADNAGMFLVFFSHNAAIYAI